MKLLALSLALSPVLMPVCAAQAPAAGVIYPGGRGPGEGKHVVLVAGDDGEYHSEEALPQLAKILAVRHGFTCTVLFSINPADGTIDPRAKGNIPGLEALKDADLLVLFIRWRDLPDDQMKMLVEYIESGRPIMAIRTGTHPFWFKTSKTYERYSWNSKAPGWEGGFGRRVLGATWEEQLGHYGHHGAHGKQSTRAWFAPGAQGNSILRGIQSGEIWVPTEVYEVPLPQPATCHALLVGQVLSGLSPTDAPVPGKLNDPMLPVAWTNSFTGEAGKTARVFVSTMGAADDLLNEALRRLLVNAAYWAVGLEDQIGPKADVALVGEYQPHSYLSETFTPGVKPTDLALQPTSVPRR
ncbi:MAG: ThuA domain-containing protein [Acidobacteriaceae bacterium]|nr:ThuA domain-containing protein [Acidobacteriaceae bacterium]